MHTFFKENGLSLVLFGFFFVFLIGLGITGYIQHSEQPAQHGQAAMSFMQYILSGDFVEAVWYESFQNWQSEFLAVGAMLVLSVFLRQRGSPESKLVGAPNDKAGE